MKEHTKILKDILSNDPERMSKAEKWLDDKKRISKEPHVLEVHIKYDFVTRVKILIGIPVVNKFLYNGVKSVTHENKDGQTYINIEV